MDAAIYTIDGRVVGFDTTKADQSDLLLCVKQVNYNTSTGVLTFTWQNGTTFDVDFNIEKIPVTFTMDANGVITMTTADGTQYTADVGSLIKTYSFTDSGRIDFTVTTDSSGNKTVTADIIDGSVTANKLQPNYLADVTAQANAASASATGAETERLKAEGWAVGQQNGVDVDSSSPYYHNNAKYYKDEAQAIAGGGVTSFNGRSGAVTPTAGDYDITQITPASGATQGQVPTVDAQGNFTMATPSSGGHTIVDSNDHAMTQRSNLMFSGSVLLTDQVSLHATKVLVKGAHYGRCNTSSAVSDKTIAYVDGDPNDDTTGILVIVEFVYDVLANATINNFPIKLNGANITDGIINAGDVVTFMMHYENSVHTWDIISISRNATANAVDTFNVATSDWVANQDANTVVDYPYVASISTAIYNASSAPVWQMNGAGTIPTEAERESINMVLEAVFSSSGVTLYATDLPTDALVLEVKGR